MPTQLEYNVTKESCREIEINVNLLNYKFQKVDELSGVVVGNPIYNVDANSDIRRTLTINIVPIDSSFVIEQGSKIWLDKYVQPIIKIKDQITGEYAETKLGIYLIDNPTTVYNKDENTITLNCYDLMAKITGLRNGNLEGLPHQILAGTNVRSAMIELVTMAGFDRYVIEECPFTVPNDILVDIGGTVYDLMKALVDIDSRFQIYFDVDGVFHYNERPSGDGQQIMIDDDIWNATLIDFQKTYDFDNVKNSITVVGKTADIDFMAIEPATMYHPYPDTLQVNIDILLPVTYEQYQQGLFELYDGYTIGFSFDMSTYVGHWVENIYLYTYDHQAIIGVGQVTTGSTIDIENPNDYYVYRYLNGDWEFLGDLTPYAVEKETNPKSPFNINGELGEIRLVLSGGEYDNIYSQDLAEQRARYELYKHCRLQDTVTINVAPIYWADVNWLVEITLPEEPTNKYLIKSISTDCSVSGTQQMTLMRFYEGDYD